MTDNAALPVKPVPPDHAVAAFRGEAVSLFEVFKANLIATRQQVIQGKTFTDCQIEGPAVLLALGGVVFDGCDMGYAAGDPKALLLMPMAKNRVIGAIAMQDCRFERCNFVSVGFTGSDAFLDQFMQVLGGSAGQ